MRAPVTSVAVTEEIKEACSVFGRPGQIRSDNGPQYTSEHFRKFCTLWGIIYSLCTIKWIFRKAGQTYQTHIVKKCIKTSENTQQTLLHVRATPIDAKLPSLAELLMKRQITTSLPSHPNNMADETIKDRLEERSGSMKKYYDRNARKEDLPPLYPGQNARILDKPSKTWCRGNVVKNAKNHGRTSSAQLEAQQCATPEDNSVA